MDSVWRGGLMLWQRSSSYLPIRLRGLSAKRGDAAVSCTVVRARLSIYIPPAGVPFKLEYAALLVYIVLFIFLMAGGLV